MASPVFVTFTNALIGASLIGSGTIRVSTQAPIAALYPITPGTQGTDATLTAVTMITFAGSGAPAYVSGSVATVAASLGIAAPTGPVFLSNIPIGSVAYGSLGTDAVSVSGTQYFSEGYNPCDRTVTNVAELNGTTAGTDKAIYFLCDATGVLVGWTALAGVTCSGTDAFQSIALVTPITLPAGRYFGGFQVNGTTTKHRTVAVNTSLLTTGSLAGVFGTLANITPPGTFTAGVGPIFYTT